MEGPEQELKSESAGEAGNNRFKFIRMRFGFA